MCLPVAFSSCNDYDAAFTPYEDDTDDDTTTITPPNIDASWNLQLITNIGQHDENVFVYKDKKYDGLFARSLGWNGGIDTQTATLPDGNILWSFGNSYFGVVDETTRARGKCNTAYNSVMVQTASSGTIGESADHLQWLNSYVQTTAPEEDNYYFANAFFTPDSIISSVAGIRVAPTFHYEVAGTSVCNNGATPTIQVLWRAINNSNNTLNGHCLATYSLDGSVGDGSYMKLISKDEAFNTDKLGYGATMWQDSDGHTYMYVVNDKKTLVARSTTHNLTTEWEYYIRDLSGNFVWQTIYPTEEERVRSSIMENNYECVSPHIFSSGDYYYMVSQSAAYGHAIYIYRSTHPYGPFSEQKKLFNVPYTIDKTGNQYYNTLLGVRLHKELSRQGELVFSISTNADSIGDYFDIPGSADFYRPYFFRVFNWQSLYDE